MKRIGLLLLLLGLGLSAAAQNPQTQSAPDYRANAAYNQGVGNGYYCTQQSGLILQCSAGTTICSNTTVHYAGGPITLTDSATNYVFLDPDSSCAISHNTTGFPAGAIRIGTFPASGGNITVGSIDDLRGFSVVTRLQASGNSGVFLTAGDVSGGLGATLCMDVNGNATTVGCAGASNLIRDCEITIGDPGSASTALADDNDSPAVCGNDFGVNYTITAVACWANAGSPTVTPVLTAGSSTSILTGALTCGTASWAAGTVNGVPTVHTFSSNGATCASTPCTIDANITTAGGTAKYIILRIKRSL